MKPVLFILLFSILLFSCNNNSESTANGAEDSTKIEKPVSDQAIQDWEKTKERLMALSPLTADDATAFFPEELLGGKREDVNVSLASGALVANADYAINDSTTIRVAIIDCAGPAGAGIFDLQFVSMFGVNEEDEDEYTKTIDFKGGKALEQCEKKTNDCHITYFVKDRLLVSLEGEHVPASELRKAANSLRL